MQSSETINTVPCPKTPPVPSKKLFQSALDRMPAQVAIINSDGVIVYVNKAWCDFGMQNGGNSASWRGLNYYQTCCNIAKCPQHDQKERNDARNITKALERFKNGTRESIEYEYPCHAPDKERWFVVTMTPFTMGKNCYVLIVHNDITDSHKEIKKLKKEHAREQKKARRDDLTDALQREPFMDEVERSIGQTDTALVLFDLDDFKKINDQAGHPVGDEVLRKCVDIIHNAIRGDDVLGRYGGDELAALLRNVSVDEAYRITERCRKEFESWSHSALTDQTATISAGVAKYRPEFTKKRDWVKAADDALYKAKSSKNKTVIAEK